MQELVLHVRPPKGCAIVLTERPFRTPSDPNWVATVGPMGPEYSRRYTAKVAELRQTDFKSTGLRLPAQMDHAALRSGIPS